MWPRGGIKVDTGQHALRLSAIHTDHADVQSPSASPATYLHDQKVRIVDVELDRMEQVLHTARLRVVSVDEVLVASTNDHLPRDRDLIMLLIAHRALCLVLVVKHNAHAGAVHPSLALLVY